MSVIIDRLNSMNIRTVSSDGTVACNLSRNKGFQIELDPYLHHVHSEESLEASIEEALIAALNGYDDAIEMIRSEARDHRPPPPPESRSEVIRQKFIDEVSELEVKAESTLGHIAIEWVGIDDIVIVIRNGTFAKLDHEAIQRELDSALNNVATKRSPKIQQCYQRVYQPRT